MTSQDQALVLIVEDEEPARRAFASALTRNGYRVLEAGSAEEALRVADECDERIHVLLMDIMLPDSWGTRLAENLRLLHPDIRVIFASGYAHGDPILRSGIDPGTPFLHKPFDVNQLLSTVEQVLAD